MRLTVFALAVMSGTIAATVAFAQERIHPDAFLDAVTGQTATFEHYPRGGLAGVEEFLDRTRSRFMFPDGTCTMGAITVENAALCFVYEADPLGRKHCWFPMQDGTRYFVMSSDWQSVQRIRSISDKQLSCEEQPMS